MRLTHGGDVCVEARGHRGAAASPYLPRSHIFSDARLNLATMSNVKLSVVRATFFDEKKYLPSVVTCGQSHKTFLSVIYLFCNKLERLSLARFCSLI